MDSERESFAEFAERLRGILGERRGDRRTETWCACKTARHSLSILTRTKHVPPIGAIETAEAWVGGSATLHDVQVRAANDELARTARLGYQPTCHAYRHFYDACSRAYSAATLAARVADGSVTLAKVANFAAQAIAYDGWVYNPKLAVVQLIEYDSLNGERWERTYSDALISIGNVISQALSSLPPHGMRYQEGAST